jgi:hypothetical protein
MTNDVADLRQYLTPAEQQELADLLSQDTRIFFPTPGPQLAAATSEADIIGYGGAAGGGKSYLISGLALTEHKRSVIFRQHKNQTRKFVQDFGKILGNSDGYSSQNSEWKLPVDPNDPKAGHRLIEFAGLEDPKDHEKWQGRDHDLYCYDEATQMREYDVRYTMGWNRTDDPNQRCRVLLTFNPPTTVEGRWVIKYFAPWLDPAYPADKRAKDGELRWFTTVGKNQDFEVPDERHFVIRDDPETGEQMFVYDFDPARHKATEIYRPKSRTFITAKVTDNPYYMETDYISTLQNMPEPLRTQMLDGDFMVGVEDDPWQVIPTAWVELAQERWLHMSEHPEFRKGAQDSIGVDVARGGNMGAVMGHVGRDKLVISARYGIWFDKLISIPGIDVNTGNLAAASVLAQRRDSAPIHIDVVGVGTSVYDMLIENHVHTIPVNGQAGTSEKDETNLLNFVNRRACIHWRMREALNPAGKNPVALPPDPELLADLTAPKYSLVTRGIQVESKDDIKKRIGRSPDRGEAVIFANMITPKRMLHIGGYATHLKSGTSYEDQRLRELDG